MYFRITILGLAFFASLCSVAAPASPASALGKMVGTFNCLTKGSDGRTWHFHSVNQMWSARWMRADTTFAPQNGQPKDTASTYVGYDSLAKRWNIVSVDTAGTYFTRYSFSPTIDRSRWSDGYPPDTTKAVLRVAGTPGYVFDTTTPAAKGPANWSHTVCTRQ